MSKEQSDCLAETQKAFSTACNAVVPYVVENHCWNRVKLHHHCYYSLREKLPEIGSQMVCNAIRKVCSSYKARNSKAGEELHEIVFREKGSVHYDNNTYKLKGDQISLYSVKGRVRCKCVFGEFQREYLKRGEAKEAELVRKGKEWHFNLVLELEKSPKKEEGKMLGVDVGENNLATTSNGTIHGGGKLRHDRDQFLAKRRRLQSNGSKSAKRELKRTSGKERRRVREMNHIVSRAVVEEAKQYGARWIFLENLKNIRERIKGNKRMRTRLHRWSWEEFQRFVEYKAEEAGIEVIYVNPAYTSKTCSRCNETGARKKHLFKCSNCGSYQHSDRNAAINILKLGESVVSSTAPVNGPKVVAFC